MALLETISGGRECPCARLGSMFSVSKATISHHMKELVTAGLVESRREGQYLHYCVRRETLRPTRRSCSGGRAAKASRSRAERSPGTRGGPGAERRW